MDSEAAIEACKALGVERLNPCFNGRWTRSLLFHKWQSRFLHGLNPCFNGRWTRSSVTQSHIIGTFVVLILVLMEDGLGVREEKNI